MVAGGSFFGYAVDADAALIPILPFFKLWDFAGNPFGRDAAVSRDASSSYDDDQYRVKHRVGKTSPGSVDHQIYVSENLDSIVFAVSSLHLHGSGIADTG